MRLHTLLCITLATLALAACGSSKPCSTHCEAISGAYNANMAAVPAAQSSCQALFFTGGSGPVQVLQTQDAITINAIFGLTGTLYDDGTIHFKQTSTVISDGSQVNVNFTGAVSGPLNARVIKGHLFFNQPAASAGGTPCTLSSSTTLTQTGPLP